MCVDARGVPDPCVRAVAAGAGELLGGVGEAGGAVAGGDVAAALREAVDDGAALPRCENRPIYTLDEIID